MKLIRPVVITDSILTSSDVPENDFPAYNPATTYAEGDKVIVTDAGIHKIYESLSDGNLNNYPPTDSQAVPPHWNKVSSTNRWKMFDQKTLSQTSRENQIQIILTPGASIDTIAFLNLECSDIRIQQVAYGNTVYDNTVECIDNGGVYDWWTYLFEPVAMKSDLVIENIPVYPTAVFTITLSSDGTIKCGEIAIGMSKTIGYTKWDVGVGIIDYSKKEVDTFGDYSVVEGKYSKRMNVDLHIDTRKVSDVIKTLAEYRATPAVWIASSNFPSTIIYGFYKNFEFILQANRHSIGSLEIEGLT